MNKIPIIAVVGPTATGKTDLAIEIAKNFSSEIISADSMQIYKEFNVCTAKPTFEQRKQILHHCLDICSVTEDFDVKKFVQIANICAKKIFLKSKIPILCGGTGLYINSFLNCYNFAEQSCETEIKRKLLKKYELQGAEILFEELKKVDEKSAQLLHQNDVKRVVRALEFFYATGKSISERVEKFQNNEKIYKYFKIGLNYSSRDILYKKINKRADNMIKKGILDEIESLSGLKLSRTASAAIGYKEISAYLSRKHNFETAIELLKKNSRNYAKRQITWFKKDKTTNWFNVDDSETFENIVETIKKMIPWSETFGIKQ